MTKADLQEWFTDKLLVEYYQWRSTLPRGSRQGVRFRGLITRHGKKRGGVGAMKQLLRSKTNKKKTQEFGGEWLVLEAKFKSLFTERELLEAQSRVDAWWAKSSK